MGEDIKPEVIKKTQDTLGKYIKKPPLLEKFLKRPTFRYLHDIVTTVIRDTKFLEGLLTPEELNHENIKDRDSKIAFLQKVIDAVKAITGVHLTVRPTKIVAGYESTKTNEFLQAIAKALDKKLSSAEYVASVNKKEKVPKTKSSTREEGGKSKTSITSKSSSHSKSQSQDRNKSKDASKKKSTSQSTKHSKTIENKSSAEKPELLDVNIAVDNAEKPIKEEQTPVVQPEPDNVEQQPIIKDMEKEKEVVEEVVTSVNKEQEIAPAEEEIDIQPIKEKEKELIRPQSAHRENRRRSARISTGRAAKVEDINVTTIGTDLMKEESKNISELDVFGGKLINSEAGVKDSSIIQRISSARPKTGVRPASARPGAPRIRDRGEVVVQEESKPTIGKVNVITESDPIKEQDEFDNFVVVEAPTASLLEEPLAVQPVVPQPEDKGQHGHLVTQILETQKELEDVDQSIGNSKTLPKKVEIEWEAGQRREREVTGKEVDRLRTSIQTLTRAANPLGKLMDFLQEDVDAMQRELDSWKVTNAELRLQLAREQSLTEQSTEPMRIQLEQLQQAIHDRLDQMSALKATILRNDMKIQHLLVGGSH